MLKVGYTYPTFSLKNQDNQTVEVSPEDGKKRVIYFYPKNNTRKCTEQACSFRQWQDDFLDLGYEVIGISADSVKSHQRFKAKNKLNFTLLSDSGGSLRKKFGATTMFGLLPSRKTFVTDEAGKIKFIYEALFEGEEHVDKIREAVKQMN